MALTTKQELMSMQYSPLPCPECGRSIRRTADSVTGLALDHEPPVCEAFHTFVEDVIPGYCDFFALFTPDPQS